MQPPYDFPVHPPYGAPAFSGPAGDAEPSEADLGVLGVEPLRGSDPSHTGPYRLLGRLGGGGMGRVYLARHATIPGPYRAGSLVAVKAVRPEYAEDERFRRRFEREIEAVRRVHGTHTAPLLASGSDGERLWMATAYAPGPSLADTVAQGGPLPREAV